MRKVKALLLLLAAAGIAAMLLVYAARERQPLPMVECVTEETLSALLAERTERARRESDGTLMVSAAPAARTADGCLVPEDMASSAFCTALNWSKTGYRAVLVFGDADKADSIASGRAFTLYVLDGKEYFTERVTFTGLPVIALISDYQISHAVPSDETPALMRLYDTNGNVTASVSGFRKRGGSSARHPKHPYRLALYQNNGKKNELSLLSLSARSAYALLPLYTDTSRVREKVCMDLWNDLAGTDPAFNLPGAQSEYVEVVIDGEYRGLFLLSEMIDAEQYGFKKSDGVRLYKVSEYFWAELLDACGQDRRKLSEIMELKFPGGDSESLWQPMYDYFDLFFVGENQTAENMERMLNVDNCIDHALFVNAIGADDNLFKNVYYLARPNGDGGYAFTKIPWDFNYSFGDHHDSNKQLRTTFYPELATVPCTVGDLSALMRADADVSKKVHARWMALRETVLTKEGLIGRFERETALLSESGAFIRDAARWPESAPDADITGVKTYIGERLRYLDAFYAETAANAG